MEKISHSSRGLPYIFFTLLIVAILSLTWFLSFSHINTVPLISDKILNPIAPVKAATISYEDALRAIYKPVLKTITNNTFTDPTDASVYSIGSPSPEWTYSLGKEFCIVDIDTRSLNEESQLFNGTFNWQNLQGVSTGMLNHYIYASIHGYDYKFIHTTKWPNDARDDVWTKIPALREILRSYRVVLMIDADAIFRHLELPFEWLLNRWNFTMDTSIAMPWDVEFAVNDKGEKWSLGYTKNKFGDINPNAGVVIAQNLPRTFEMLDAWIACPDDEAFTECAKFHHGWPAEQGAFGEQIRYRFKESSDFVGFNCDDANGFPNQGTECKGSFIRHFTTGKDQLKQATGNALLQTVMARTQLEMEKDDNTVVVVQNSSEIIEKEFW